MVVAPKNLILYAFSKVQGYFKGVWLWINCFHAGTVFTTVARVSISVGERAFVCFMTPCCRNGTKRAFYELECVRGS